MLLTAGLLAAAVWFLSGWYRLAIVRGKWTTTFQGGHVVSVGLTPDSPRISVMAHGGHPSLTAYKWTAFPPSIWGVEFQWSVLLVSHAYNPLNGYSAWSVVVWPVPVALCGAGALMLAWGRRARRRAMRGLCAKCGYSLSGLAEGKACPECGEGADRP
ncbi:MAG: hypothetical protein QM783_01940 [Phycisphaerales bacterium]